MQLYTTRSLQRDALKAAIPDALKNVRPDLVDLILRGHSAFERKATGEIFELAGSGAAARAAATDEHDDETPDAPVSRAAARESLLRTQLQDSGAELAKSAHRLDRIDVPPAPAVPVAPPMARRKSYVQLLAERTGMNLPGGPKPRAKTAENRPSAPTLSVREAEAVMKKFSPEVAETGVQREARELSERHGRFMRGES